MSQYDNNNRGAIWANVKTKDTQPDFTGSILVDGKDYFLSGWKRKADANPKRPSIKPSCNIKENQPHAQPPQQSTQMADRLRQLRMIGTQAQTPMTLATALSISMAILMIFHFNFRRFKQCF